MKKIFKFSIAMLIAFGPLTMMAQNPPHPNGGEGIGGGTPIGGGAPIDGGLSMLIVMGSAYAIGKVFKYKLPTS